MKKYINVDSEVIRKFSALSQALEDCGISATISVMQDGSVSLSAPLWNCEDGSGEVFEVFALAVENFEICHAVENCGRSYEELCENFEELSDF